MSRVLVLAGALDDQEQAVVGRIRLQAGAGSPGVAAVVGNRLGDGVNGLDVGAGSTQEHQRDLTRSGGIPLDGVGLAGRDLLLQTGLNDSVARGRLRVVRLGVSRSQGRKGGDEGGDGKAHDVLSCN